MSRATSAGRIQAVVTAAVGIARTDAAVGSESDILWIGVVTEGTRGATAVPGGWLQGDGAAGRLPALS